MNTTKAIKTTAANRKVAAVKALHDLTALLGGELPPEGFRYEFATEGGLFPATFIRYVADRAVIRNLCLSTFNYGKREVLFLHSLKASGRLDNVRMVAAHMYAMSSKAGGIERLRSFTADVFARNGWSIAYNDNHSKLYLMDTEAGAFVLKTSCNFSHSTSDEWYSFERSQEMYDFYRSRLDERTGCAATPADPARTGSTQGGDTYAEGLH